MATPEEIEHVRELIDELDTSRGWDDPRIGKYVDREANAYLAASAIWLAKAGSFASLVDVTESGSSRKMGGLQKNALQMSEYYKNLGMPAQVEPGSGPTIISKIRRG